MVLYALVPPSGDLLREFVCLVHDPTEEVLHLLLIALPVVQQTKQLVTSDSERVCVCVCVTERERKSTSPSSLSYLTHKPKIL